MTPIRLILATFMLMVLFVPFLGAIPTDTVGLRPVEITGSHWLDADAEVLPTTQITHADLLRLRPMNASEALRGVPGLFMRDYGGLGGLKSISIRGGSSAQSLVLVDGFRWNSAQNGGVDLGWIPATMINTMSVQRGAASALHGANAMTGTLNIQLATSNTDQVRAIVDAGSFNTWRASIAGSTTFNDVGVMAAVESYGSDGRYPYDVTIDHADAELLRANADARSTSAMIRGTSDRYSITTMIRSSDRGVPGAVVEGAVTQPRARLDDLDVWGLASGTLIKDTSSSLTTRVGFRYLDQRYSDPDATFTGSGGIDARYLLRDASADVVWSGSGTRLLHQATLSAGYVDLRGGSLDPGVGDLVVRRTIAAAFTTQYVINENSSVEGTIRGDAYSDVGSAISASLGARMVLHPGVTMRASLGTGFRPPSFNELYFLNYGTSTLRPERSIMASVGGLWSPLAWLTVDANVFASRITDLIVSVPISPVVTSAQNVGNAISYGLELSTRFSLFNDNVFGQWSYTLQRVEDRTGRPQIDGTLIPYTPMEMFAVQSWWDDGQTIASVEWNYVSYRYAQPGAEITSLLAPYHLIHASIGQVVPARDLEVTFLLRCDNLLDERYAVVRGYPMPGRTVRLTVSVNR